MALEDAGWGTPPPPELLPCIGLVGRIRTVELTQDRRDALRRSLGTELSDAATSLADFCPDPLVLALDSGLPRVRLLGRVVDGGSEWEQRAAVTPGSLLAVSRIAAIAQRTSSAGRRMIRTTYETEFRSARGALIGIARGFSIDMDPV